jgi:predicted secreted Zn-dependent protease
MRRGTRAAVQMALLAVSGAAVATAAAAGGVTATTETEYYALDGDTPTAIVNFFHAHPFSGDRGPALANIRYTAELTVATRESGSGCRAAAVDLHLDFVVTLPTSDEIPAMSRRTRAMWNELAAFAKAHEYGHRAMDLQCARSFIARAQRISGDTCGSVEDKVRDMLEASESACDAAQTGYDQRESKRAANLLLFRAARAGN